MTNNQKNSNQVRLYNIDFLRFMFAFMIMYYHLMFFIIRQFPKNDVYMNLYWKSRAVGGNVVWAFFILSGYFLYKSVLSKPLDIKTFIKNRIIRLWPLMALSFIPFIFLKMFDVYDFLNLFFINSGIGIIKSPSHNGVTWFVCVLFWQSIAFYYFLAKYKEKFLPVCCLFAFFSFVWLTHAPNGGLYGSIVLPSVQLTAGMVKGLGGISLGIVIYRMISQNSEFNGAENTPSHRKLIFSVCEIALLILTVYYLCNHKAVYNEIFYQLIVCGLIICFALNKGVVSSILNNNICKTLGAWSYGIYVMHFPIIALIKRYVWEKDLISSPILMVIFCSTVCVISGWVSTVACNYLVKKIAKR